MEKNFGKYTASITKDDRGALVVELWHTASGKTIGITEVDTEVDGWHWVKKTLEHLPK